MLLNLLLIITSVKKKKKIAVCDHIKTSRKENNPDYK